MNTGFSIFLATVAITWGLSACGVKGKPLAPLNPEVMGHGLPEYRGSNNEVTPGNLGPEDDKKTRKTQ